MSNLRQNLTVLAIVSVVLCCLLAYLCKPKQSELELVNPAQELPNYQAQFPGDTKLEERIVKSYQLAIILTQTPYMQKNFNALECIRRWGKEQFAAQPDFLHPVVLPAARENRDTVFGAFGYNLFSGAHSWIKEQLAPLVKLRIDEFQKTDAYRTFRVAYFDFFGWEADSALLLARYQSERARVAIDVILWSAAWVAAVTVAAYSLLRARRSYFWSTLQKAVARTWALLAFSYFVQSWFNEQSSSLLSMVIAAGIAVYLFCPVSTLSSGDEIIRLVRVKLSPKWIATAAWLTLSCLAVQVLTWIRQSPGGANDPITMLIAALTGNFVHDPTHGKRWVTMVTAAIWLVATAWAWKQRSKNYESEFDADTDVNRLDVFKEPSLSVK